MAETFGIGSRSPMRCCRPPGRRVATGAIASAALCAVATVLLLTQPVPAQVGRCTTLQQSYITCGDVSGRNSTVIDIRKRFQGFTETEPESIENLKKAYPSFEFRAPVEPIVTPKLDMSRPPRERFEIFTPIERPEEPGP